MQFVYVLANERKPLLVIYINWHSFSLYFHPVQCTGFLLYST
jgi:hypothetical protein